MEKKKEGEMEIGMTWGSDNGSKSWNKQLFQ